MVSEPKKLFNAKGQYIGNVIDDVLYKFVRGSIHFLQQPPAIALDVDAVHEAQKIGATTIKVHDEETGIDYTTTVAILWKRGVRIDRGHSPQIALPFKWWTELNPFQIQMFEEA